MIPHTKKVYTCKFTLENLCFCSSALTFVRYKKIRSGVLKDMVWEQTIHNISNILEWRVDIREEDRDMVGGQVSSNPEYPFDCCKGGSNPLHTLMKLGLRQLPRQ
jgi:hypothetical protein